MDNCIVNVPHRLYNVIWRRYVHGQEELNKLKQAARLESYGSYSEFVRRTSLIEADKVISDKKRENNHDNS